MEVLVRIIYVVEMIMTNFMERKVPTDFMEKMGMII